MGATYWEAVTGYDEVLEEALRRVQIQVYREAGHDLPRRLSERVESMAQAVRWCEEDDPYNLLGFYRDALGQYRQMAAGGVPEEPEAQIRLLRAIETVSGDRVGNILDMTGVSEGQEEGKIQRLSTGRMEEAFGTASPSLHEARRAMVGLVESIPRGTAICFPVYEAGRPMAWFLAGCSAD